MDVQNAPVSNEASHLAAGLFIWNTDQFDLYHVNPPLVRLVASAPVVGCRPNTDWKYYQEQHEVVGARPEWSTGISFVRDNLDHVRQYFAIARWACIPFSLIGAYVCWKWASELYGSRAGAMALMLWCFSPNVMAWSATICPDAAAAGIGIAACYCFWTWLRNPVWTRALIAGTVLGLAQLTKMTWLILFGAWPVLWLVWAFRVRPQTIGRRTQMLNLLAILLTAVYVLNLGYLFQGTFTRLDEFTFASRTLAGADSIVAGGSGGNRFAGSWLGGVPVPLPSDYVLGADLQKVDFEVGLSSYLFGQWRDRGWWYYYIVCAVLKVPLGTWTLALLAMIVRLKRPRRNVSDTPEHGVQEQCFGERPWREEAVLILPALLLVVFVSSQTGFSCHFRYVLPAFPFLFIWVSRVAQTAQRKRRTIGVLAACALCWSVASSLSIYPHSMSYFNELAGGPENGHYYLLGSNLDWGQDNYRLKEWCDTHPEATPLYLLLRNSYSADLLERSNAEPPKAPRSTEEIRASDGLAAEESGPRPGWYGTSVQRIHDPTGQYLYFLRFRPVAMAGYSNYVYHITIDEANRVRRELGLPELSE